MVVELVIEPFWFSTDWLCYPANAEFFIQLFENLHINHVLLVEAVHCVFRNYLLQTPSCNEASTSGDECVLLNHRSRTRAPKTFCQSPSPPSPGPKRLQMAAKSRLWQR